MSELFRYLLQSSICVTILYGVYILFLRNDTFFKVNRFYLVASAIVSMILPLVSFQFLTDSGNAGFVYTLDTITITPDEVRDAVNTYFNFFQVVMIVYLTGTVLFTLRLIFQLTQIYFISRKHGVTWKDGVGIVLINSGYSPFSFFNLIFLNAANYKQDQLKEIIEHEKIHVKQKHSIDLILLEILTVIQWFNPFVWLYRQTLKGVHEYLADEGVLLRGMAVINYQNLLINQVMGVQLNDMTNNFNQSLLKRRFIMMTKNRSGKVALLKPLFALPVIILLVLSFSIAGSRALRGQDDQSSSGMENSIVLPESVDLSSIDQATGGNPQEEVFKEVAVKPEFKGGMDGLVQYILSEIKYPEEAKKKGITGKVFVNFVVDKKGNIKNAKVEKAVDPMLDAEALRVISKMPAWTPGKDDKGNPVNVAMSLPIAFSLDEKKAKEQEKK